MSDATGVTLKGATASPQGVEGWLALLAFALGVGAPARRLYAVWEEIVTSEHANPSLSAVPLWHSITTAYWTITILAAALSMFDLAPLSRTPG